MEIINAIIEWNFNFLFFMLISGGIFYFLTVVTTLLVHSINKKFVWLSILPPTVLGTALFAYLIFTNPHNQFAVLDMVIIMLVTAVHAAITVALVVLIMFVGRKKKGRNS